MTSRAQGLRVAFIGVLLSSLVAGGWFLVHQTRARFDDLASAQSDNVQWVLSQVEVEYLALDIALLRTGDLGAERLPAIRQSFDIFYSRINTLRRSPLFTDLRGDAAFAGALDIVWTAIEESVPLIDGPQDALLASVVDLEARFAAVDGAVRQIGLAGLSHFAAISDTRREEFLAALRDLAWLTVALFAVLALMVALLWRAIRVLDEHARDARETASRMEAVVSSSLDAVIVADTNGVIIETNEAVAEVFGYVRDELVGRSMAETIIPEHLRAAHDAGMKRYQSTREPHVIGKGRVQLEARHKNGHHFPVELSISNAKSADGEVFVSFLRDITRRVTAEKDLRAARDRAEEGEKAKAKMLATMSHEMRTPLNGLLGTLELLEDADLDPVQARYLKVMRSSGDILLHHIDDVLDISRLDAGKTNTERKAFALNPMLEALVASQEPLAEQSGNLLTLSPLPEPDGVLGDHVRLRQVLLNLLGNAIKFTDGGTISLEAERLDGGETIEFRVADTGLGIAEDQLGRVFEDFVTLDSSYGRVHGGTGLGLGIVRRTVKAMGGEVGVESELGEGSLFWVRLPLPVAVVRSEDPAGSSPQAPRQPHRKDPSGRKHQTDGRSVLIVEDNEINRMILREMLERLGHRVTEAVDGAAGVSAADAEQFDLILMDISMPNVDGVTAAERIRASQGASRETPIVALTAHAMPEEMTRFAAAGMARTIVKPVTRAALGAVLEDLHARPAAPVGPHGGGAGDDVIDVAVLADVREGLGDELFATLSRTFVAEADSTLGMIAEPNGATPSDVIARVHKLAGGCGMVGATALRNALSEIEARAKQNPSAAPEIDIGHLQTLWARTRPHFAETPKKQGTQSTGRRSAPTEPAPLPEEEGH